MAAGLIQRAAPPRWSPPSRYGAGQDPGGLGRRRAAAPGLDNDAVRVLDSAEQLSAKAGDSFVAVQRILQALAMHGGAAGQALKAANVTAHAGSGDSAT
jgi:ATP-dependent Clp protease ATP-binding subunit ClpB